MKADYQMLRLKAIMKAVQGCMVLFAYKTTAKSNSFRDLDARRVLKRDDELEPEELNTIIQARLLKAINNLKK